MPLTQSQIEKFAHITDVDIQKAIQLWLQYSTPRYKGLLESKVTFDPITRHYISSNNKSISNLQIRDNALEPFINKLKIQLRQLATSLQNKEINLSQFELASIDLIKSASITSGFIANGGIQNQTEADKKEIALLMITFLLFFKGLINDIVSGVQLLNGTLLSRLDLYGNSPRSIFEETGRYIQENYLGTTQERRVLQQGANHCITDDELEGCVELAQKGWKPIGTLPRLYETPCRTNCKCHFEYK